MNTNVMTPTRLVARRIAANVRLAERNAQTPPPADVTLDRWEASTLVSLIQAGGPEQFIDEAVTQAAREARVTEAQEWLEAMEAARPQIEALVATGESSTLVCHYNEYIKTLRRMAGERAPPNRELIRAQTRERVRRFRARRRLKGGV